MVWKPPHRGRATVSLPGAPSFTSPPLSIPVSPPAHPVAPSPPCAPGAAVSPSTPRSRCTLPHCDPLRLGTHLSCCAPWFAVWQSHLRHDKKKQCLAPNVWPKAVPIAERLHRMLIFIYKKQNQTHKQKPQHNIYLGETNIQTNK